VEIRLKHAAEGSELEKVELENTLGREWGERVSKKKKKKKKKKLGGWVG